VREQVEIQAKYAGYIDRQQTDINRALRYEGLSLAPNMNYQQVRGLSSEVVEKLNRHQPETLGQAGRVQGVTPAAISLLLVHLKKKSA
jgi:tRNA uridine 5-carboxymethylaminomethyl modification enzyme